MGNPTITRLGRTQFWYKKWYTDLTYNSLLKTTHTLETLLNFYFRYGLFFTKNIFFHNYWYKNSFFKKHNYGQDSKQKSLYFRKYYYAHQTLTIEHSYFIRLKTPEFFPLRLYILKYAGWILASVQWFKPLKTVKALKNNYNNQKLNSLVYTSYKNQTKKKRDKILILLLLSFYKKTKLKYYF
jgi:hypothetical protein